MISEYPCTPVPIFRRSLSLPAPASVPNRIRASAHRGSPAGLHARLRNAVVRRDGIERAAGECSSRLSARSHEFRFADKSRPSTAKTVADILAPALEPRIPRSYLLDMPICMITAQAVFHTGHTGHVWMQSPTLQSVRQPESAPCFAKSPNAAGPGLWKHGAAHVMSPQDDVNRRSEAIK